MNSSSLQCHSRCMWDRKFRILASEKISLFYGTVISRPQLFRKDFIVDFVTYTRVYTVHHLLMT